MGEPSPRHHHRYSDGPEDVHRPSSTASLAHMGWLLSGHHVARPDVRSRLVRQRGGGELVGSRVGQWGRVDPDVRSSSVKSVALRARVGLFRSTVPWHGTFHLKFGRPHKFGSRAIRDRRVPERLLLALLVTGEGYQQHPPPHQASRRRVLLVRDRPHPYLLHRALNAPGHLGRSAAPPPQCSPKGGVFDARRAARPSFAPASRAGQGSLTGRGPRGSEGRCGGWARRGPSGRMCGVEVSRSGQRLPATRPDHPDAGCAGPDRPGDTRRHRPARQRPRGGQRRVGSLVLAFANLAITGATGSTSCSWRFSSRIRRATSSRRSRTNSAHHHRDLRSSRRSERAPQ